MKILYFSPHPHINMAAPSGPGTHIREIIAGFEAQGHNVVRLIAGGETASAHSRTIAFKQSLWKRFIPSILWETLRDMQMILSDRKIEKQLNALIDKENPDLLYERSCYGMGAGMRAARKAGLRYVVEMNAPYPEEKKAMQGPSLLNFLGTRHERNQVHGAYRTIVVSSAMKKYLVEKTNVSPDAIIVVANAVNPDHIRIDAGNAEEIKSNLGLSGQHRVIGFVGSIFPYHGVDLMIEAFSIVAGEHPTARMLIVGDGEILPALKKRSELLQIDNKVIFTGNVSHSAVYTYLSLMDIAVMARSNWYGSPVKIFEYGAMQKAIIAPNVIPVTDVMENGVHGLLISDSTEELTEALRFLIEKPGEGHRMAKCFHDKVMTEHTWKQVAKQILKSCA
ncbi:MAG: glycosyltransferase family 4 protein [Flavobacteriales bacterium]